MSLWHRTTLEDEIDFLTSAEHVSPFSKHVLIYYVPGNPGLIEYYRDYLKHLTRALSQQSSAETGLSHQTQYHVHGASLAGFQLQADLQGTPRSLDEIKAVLIKDIETQARETIDTHDLKQDCLPVILIGHSIGTWLSLETIAATAAASTTPTARIQGAILLFPTIVDIGKSPNGRRLGWLIHLPYAALILALIAKLLFLFVPLFLLTAVLQVLLGMEHRSALVTSTFLKSSHGVQQALYMARGEFLQVKDDTWSNSLWGVQSSGLTAKEAKALAKDAAATSAKLYFFWGANDHWVANTTRDEVITRRARVDASSDHTKPYMEIDNNGLPHAFAVTDRGARIVANKSAAWIKEIVQQSA